jgi:Cdc6-like AAA superfamily ATPase
LEGCSEEWATQERHVRQEQVLTALQILGDQAARSSDHAQSIALYKRAIAVDSLRDEPVRALMLVLSAKGDANGALQTYREFAHRLSQNLGGVPDERTAELYIRLRRKNLQRTRAPKFEPQSHEVPEVGSLPHPLNSLIGREDERTEIASQLRLSRLVTLTGMGGIGKTRLAIEVASEVRSSFTDGVWFVPLEALSEGTQVAQAIASTLALRVETGSSPLDALAKGLRLKQVLLVLDNCEHLLESCRGL